MKIMNFRNLGKKKLFAGILAATLIFGSGVAFAFTSTDFATKAQTWVSTNCNNPTGANNIRAFQCYLWHKSAEQQTSLNNQQGSISNLQSRVTALESNNTPPIDFTFFNGFPTNNSSPIFDANNYSKISFTIKCNGYPNTILYVSNDQTNWLPQKDFGNTCGNAEGNTYEGLTSGRYYLVSTSNTSISLNAIGRFSK